PEPSEEAGASPAQPGSRPGPPRHVGMGRLALGVILLGAGVVWLLDAVGAFSVSAVVVLPAVLIAVGLVILALPGHHGGLIGLGIVLTLILALTSSFEVKLQGGVGDHLYRPTSVADLHRSYHLAMGQLTLDLTQLRLEPGTYRI